MEAAKRLRIAYTPDRVDAFCYGALETGDVTLSGFDLEFLHLPMNALHRAALAGQYDITTISSVVYPRIARRYAILSAGTSVGRGYGPVLVSREPRTLEELAGRPVGVGGIPTTGWFLLRCLCPEAVPLEMPLDRIADAVAAGELEAGVMLHEELLYDPRQEMHRVVDLGAEWCQRNGLPLPLRLNVIRRDLGMPAMQRLCGLLRRSLRHALEHPRETLSRVRRFGRGDEENGIDRFVSLFASEDSVRMSEDVRMGLRVLFAQTADLGLCDTIPPLDIVEAASFGREPQTSAGSTPRSPVTRR